MFLFVGSIAVDSAVAADWSLCKVPPAIPEEPVEPLSPDTPMEFSADRAQFNPKGVSVLSGNVRLNRGGQQLNATELRFDHLKQRINANLDVDFTDRGFSISAPQAEIELGTDEARFADTTYSYAPMHAQGSAKILERDSSGLVTLTGATYTTCDPGDPDWLMSAGKVRLDRDKGQGTARNMVFRFKSVPLAWLPWISFPIDDRRKSGFLVPELGTSTESGAELSIPYYWNIAANRDATLTPRFLLDRGAQIRSNFRFLTRRSDGEIDFEYLEDEEFNDERYQWGVHAKRQLTTRLGGNIEFQQVSDQRYFQDLGTSLTVSSTTHLPRRGDLFYRGNSWDLLTRVESYQTVDATIEPLNEPYRRLPQVLLNAGVGSAPWPQLALRNEWVSFDRDAGVTGERLDVSLTATRPFAGAGYFFNPSAEWKYTEYRLENEAAGVDQRPDRSVPVLSLDSGLIFERGYRNGWLQTLEPRLYYLNVPFREQADIPTFDSGRLDFSFSQLFRDDRFTGADRVGDANQLTIGLTSRFLDLNSGRELVSASAGQILYFRDREVTLPDEPPEMESTSDFAAELSFRPGENWTLQSSLLWDPDAKRTERSTTQLLFAGENNRVLNLSYRLQRDELEQTDLALAWPLSPRWRVLARWNYSLTDQQDLDLLGGLEYESCCYKVRFAHRRFVNDNDDRLNRTYLVQLEFKGLASVGTPLDSLLERGILGYRNEE